ncbi:MAG: M48 family metallopeptidase [Candidatus Diapherotrites archaeon]|nr:M48 family metallopeptidase [Candidatus Diapherotrites archaeon]
MATTSFYDEISRNKRNSILLTGFVFLVLAALIYSFSLFIDDQVISTLFLAFAFVLASAHIFVSYNYGDKIVLKSVGAVEANRNDVKDVYFVNTVEGLAIAAGLPAPKAYVIDSGELNAFATGKDPKHASIAVTRGLMKVLKREELEGVVAHEMSHIKNYDIRFATLIAVLVGLVAILSHMFLRFGRYGLGGRSRGKGGGIVVLIIVFGFVLAIISPLVTRMVQASISRKREFMADAGGAKLTRYPEGLAGALEKISKTNKGTLKVSEAVSHLFFADPVRSHLDGLFATHPPIEKRIEVLRSM